MNLAFTNVYELLFASCFCFMFLCQQLQYYKQGKTDDFVKLLEASRTGMCLIIIINNNCKQGWALRKIEGSPEL